MYTIKLLITSLLFLTITGCGCIYKPDIQQGNTISSAQACALRLGMTKEDVRYLLGTPVMSHVLNQERWDYVYTFQSCNGPMRIKRLILYFSRGRLVSVCQKATSQE
jgi:outer membrane protein assembly factor BamE